MTKLSRDHARRLTAARAYVFDMDGTLVLGDPQGTGHKALPCAAALISRLRSRGTPFRVFTNGSTRKPSDFAASLRKAGLDVADSEMMTPSTAAAAWFIRKGISKVRVLGKESVTDPLVRSGIEVFEPSESASGVEAIFVGGYREFTFRDFEVACQDIWDGALLTSASNVPFFAAAGGRAIGPSYAINAMLRAMTGKRPRILGKPSRDALRSALRLMGLPHSAEADTVIVGDDPALELRMARSAGAFGVAVTTGLHPFEDIAARGPKEAADLILPGLAPLLEALS